NRRGDTVGQVTNPVTELFEKHSFGGKKDRSEHDHLLKRQKRRNGKKKSEVNTAEREVEK
ncbi:MAG: hypothetical protein IJB41_07580, partial [Clostridia bacterium]|nr:hypothetical protein [Clostridia bacterium]